MAQPGTSQRSKVCVSAALGSQMTAISPSGCVCWKHASNSDVGPLGAVRPEQGYGLKDMADDLAGVITGLGLQRPAVLGHSMGGGTAFVLAGTYPELPGAILIEDTGMLNLTAPKTPADQERGAQMRALITELKRKTREEMITEQRVASPSWSETELGPWADAKLRFSFNALNRLGVTAVDWQATLRRVTCPALLMTADPALGAIVTEEDAVAIKTLIPQLRVVHIPEAGHSIRREQFDRYIDVVRSFLAEVTASAEWWPRTLLGVCLEGMVTFSLRKT
jgi:N-formylmaleamate deformylase